MSAKDERLNKYLRMPGRSFYFVSIDCETEIEAKQICETLQAEGYQNASVFFGAGTGKLTCGVNIFCGVTVAAQSFVFRELNRNYNCRKWSGY